MGWLSLRGRRTPVALLTVVAALWLCAVASASPMANMVGFGECLDCADDKAAAALKDIHVTVLCKAPNGMMVTAGSSLFSVDAQVRVKLPGDLISKGGLKAECFAQLSTTSKAAPCPVENGPEHFRINVLPHSSTEEALLFAISGATEEKKMAFSHAACSAALFSPDFWFFKPYPYYPPICSPPPPPPSPPPPSPPPPSPPPPSPPPSPPPPSPPPPSPPPSPPPPSPPPPSPPPPSPKPSPPPPSPKPSPPPPSPKPCPSPPKPKPPPPVKKPCPSPPPPPVKKPCPSPPPPPPPKKKPCPPSSRKVGPLVQNP